MKIDRYIKRYANIKQVAEYTSLPVKTLYEWASIGRIPSIKLGRRVLFDLHEIDEVMVSLKRPYLQHEKTADKIVGGINGNGI
jgi:excisionase family DNA binding protein